MAKRFIGELGKDLCIEEEELDAIRSILVYTLMESSSLDIEDICSYIYGNGKKILWN